MFAATGGTAKLMTALALLAAASACDSIPKDAADTSERIETHGEVRTGIITNGGEDKAQLRAFGAAVARSASAEPVYTEAGSEMLLAELEKGNVDIVVGHLAKSSPWAKMVSFTSPWEAERPPRDQEVIRAAVRHGENRWLMQVERVIAEHDRP